MLHNNMPIPAVIDQLFCLQDTAYRAFQAKLIPTVAAESVIGVRTPVLRTLAKQLVKADRTEAFIAALPHRYFDENQLHAFIISETKNFDTCIAQVEQFLPYIDNWATCDQLLPRVFKKHHQALLTHIDRWLVSPRTYTVRFAIGMLLRHFLDDDFNPVYLQKVAALRSEEYYIRMMVAWYIATALAKQYDASLPIIQEQRLDPWTHNKAIQKACESYRITDEQKAYLRTLKIKTKQNDRSFANERS